jgi:hypothetical protein
MPGISGESINRDFRYREFRLFRIFSSFTSSETGGEVQCPICPAISEKPAMVVRRVFLFKK